MDLETFSFNKEQGWSVDAFPPVDSAQTMLLVFGASSFLDRPGVIGELVQAYPRSHIAGCSTSGEIFGAEINDDSLTVAVARFNSCTLKSAFTSIDQGTSSFQAGETLANALNSPDLRGVLVFSDGLHVNGSELVRGLNAKLPDSVVVSGGLAGDGDRFERTWTLHDGRPVESYVSAVGLYGDAVQISHGSKGGWDRFGPARLVTRSEGNVLYELDNRPALELYKQYLGEMASELPAAALRFPLSLKSRLDDEKSVVRTILAVDEEKQSMTFAGDIPEGAYAQLMYANFDRLVEGASDAADITRQQCGEDPGALLAIAISCVGRRLVLGEASEEEVESTLNGLPHGTRQIGFYSYGEISPYSTGQCDLHNQTMTLTTIGEAA